jgi:U3 small nucleolar RNA-associated protein MPP10
MESALPTSASTSTMIAPEEMFGPVSIIPRARSEMTPQEKQALRNKERKVKQKMRNALRKDMDKHVSDKRTTKVKQNTLDNAVKRGKGVIVVGKAKRMSVNSQPK